MKKYFGIATGFILAGSLMFATAPAAARVNVDIVVGMPGFIQPAPVYVYPEPVYVQPRPVYMEPRPVYVQPRPVYVQPSPVYVQPYPVFIEGRRGHHRGHDRRWNHEQNRGHRHYGY